MKTKTIKFLMAGLLGLTGVSLAGISLNNNSKAASAYSLGTTYKNHDADTYYSEIDSSKSGEALLADLRSLNNSKRKSTVGYDGMGTSMSGAYAYTDYSTKSTINYDKNGQPYGTKVISFYSGNETTSWNREHVWPNSHGGNVVENDIHMPRPTIPAENGSRGNSFYVEGMCDGSQGWDPAEEDFGLESYRGDSARIIFYCVVASSKLELLDVSYHSTSNANKDYKMGKLSDLLKWNLENPVLEREKNRNEGAEYLQGNRNPFIDHPEYACKIWGNYNDETRKICSGTQEAPTQITLTANPASVAVGGSITISATVDKGSTDFIWDSSDKTVATVSNGVVNGIKAGTAEISARSVLDPNVVGKITISVKAVSELKMTGTPTKTNYFAGQSFNPDGLTITATYTDSTTENVTSAVVWEPSPLYAGLTEVTGKYAGKSVKVTGLTVENASNYTLISNQTDLTDGDSIVIASNANGRTAGDTSGTYLEDVASTFSSDKSEITSLGNATVEFTAKKSGSGWSFETEDGNLVVTGEKKVNIVDQDCTWNVAITNGTAKLTGSSDSWGTLQYNANSPRFTTYKSNQQSIQLYHKAGGGTGGDDKVHVTSVQLNKNELALEVGKTETLTATVLPANASDKSLTWESSDIAIATVSNGVVTAVANGVATITAKSVDGNITDECVVTVTGGQEPIKVTGVALNKTAISLKVEDTETLVATVNPTNAENKAVTWTTSDQTIATVNDGVVTAIAKGEATITVTTTDGGFTATCKVTVVNKDEPLPTPTPKNGCSGSIVATSSLVAATSLIGLVILGFKKKKEF